MVTEKIIGILAWSRYACEQVSAFAFDSDQVLVHVAIKCDISEVFYLPFNFCVSVPN